MAWQFNTKTGGYWQDGQLRGYGYSGFGEGHNNPALEGVANVGPIPRGRYRMTLLDGDHGALKAPVIRLTPEGHSACGRDGFLIHGDNWNHTASQGCAVTFLHSLRVQIADSLQLPGNEFLDVVADI